MKILGNFYKISFFEDNFNEFVSTIHEYMVLFINGTPHGYLFTIHQHPHPPLFRRVRGTPASFPQQNTPPHQGSFTGQALKALGRVPQTFAPISVGFRYCFMKIRTESSNLVKKIVF